MALGAGDERAHDARVERGQPADGQAAQRPDLRHERSDQQRFHETRVGDKRVLRIEAGDSVGVELVGAQQHRKETLRPESPGLRELRPHHLGQRFVARVDRVEEIAEGYELSDFQPIAIVY